MKRIGFLFSLVAAMAGLSSGYAHGQALPVAQGQPVVPRTAQLPSPALTPALPAVQTPAAVPAAAPQLPIGSFLAFDAEEKDVSVSNGTPESHFSFDLTNISSGDVTINFVQASCGCTVAKLPSQPWKLASKESGQFSATMQLNGVPPGGFKAKTLTVNTDKGAKVLIVKTTVLPAPAALNEMDRTGNQKMAMADRQAVFKGDCVKCHMDTAKDSTGNDKTGKDLYVAVCGVCHDSDHRASFVPNLHAIPEPTSVEFWKNWILHGKQGTLMPAFAKSEGGILSDAQVQSLVTYLAATIPSHPVPVVVPTRAQVN